MSRPGYWKTKEGMEIAYGDMETSHVKHSLRYLRNRLLAVRSLASPNISTITYYENKLEDLGNEAQRRNLIPQGDITLDQLLGHIEVWQTEWDARRPVVVVPAPIHYSTPSTPITLDSLFSVQSEFIAPPVTVGDFYHKPAIKPFKKAPVLSKAIDVEVEISRVTGFRIQGPAVEMDVEYNRRLDIDL